GETVGPKVAAHNRGKASYAGGQEDIIVDVAVRLAARQLRLRQQTRGRRTKRQKPHQSQGWQRVLRTSTS
ncbi:MAG TPA: hypothetical protein DCR15_01420, partial [Arthrobacter bacterium]|nr:hypothetical protein [Arthrobacter sp.]